MRESKEQACEVEGEHRASVDAERVERQGRERNPVEVGERENRESFTDSDLVAEMKKSKWEKLKAHGLPSWTYYVSK